MAVTLLPSSPRSLFPSRSLFATFPLCRRQSHRSRAKPIVRPVSCKFPPLALPPARAPSNSRPLISSGAVIFSPPRSLPSLLRSPPTEGSETRSLARAKFDFGTTVLFCRNRESFRRCAATLSFGDLARSLFGITIYDKGATKATCLVLYMPIYLSILP